MLFTLLVIDRLSESDVSRSVEPDIFCIFAFGFLYLYLFVVKIFAVVIVLQAIGV